MDEEKRRKKIEETKKMLRAVIMPEQKEGMTLHRLPGKQKVLLVK